VISAYALTGLAAFVVPDNIPISVVFIIKTAGTLSKTIDAVGFSVFMNSVINPDGYYKQLSRPLFLLVS
jgi:hypothetical protein